MGGALCPCAAAGLASSFVRSDRQIIRMTLIVVTEEPPAKIAGMHDTAMGGCEAAHSVPELDSWSPLATPPCHTEWAGISNEKVA